MPTPSEVREDYFEREGEDDGDIYHGERKDPKADPDCPACHGLGYITDLVPVPFGSGNCVMQTGCECLADDSTEEDKDDDAADEE